MPWRMPLQFSWMFLFLQGDDKPDSSEGGAHDIIDPNQSSLLHDQINSTNEM